MVTMNRDRFYGVGQSSVDQINRLGPSSKGRAGASGLPPRDHVDVPPLGILNWLLHPIKSFKDKRAQAEMEIKLAYERKQALYIQLSQKSELNTQQQMHADRTQADEAVYDREGKQVVNDALSKRNAQKHLQAFGGTVLMETADALAQIIRKIARERERIEKYVTSEADKQAYLERLEIVRDQALDRALEVTYYSKLDPALWGKGGAA